MIRARFVVPSADPRPVKWPIPHPYWITGYDSDGRAIIVAYADDEDQVAEQWPDAIDIESSQVDGYSFTDRFPRPYWLADPSDPEATDG